jgi:peptidyl-tRNA hydrolase
MKHKMYCIFALESVKKMNGIRGKMCTQAGHAYLHAFWDANYAANVEPFTTEDFFRVTEEVLIATRKVEQAQAYYNSERAYKITLIVDTVEELKALQEKYKDICGTSLVTDAGFTVFNEPTTTCLGLGPISEDNIGDDIKSLKTFT